MSRRKYVLALSFIAATGAAYADQQADSSSDEAVETVEVTGIRHAIQEAIEEKKNSGSIVEAITAEDIGKLPDTSIAESISRLPGLTSQRAEGRASAISLRGTDPGFTTTLMNGREQVSTGDNRSIEYDQYPSELISSVIVYKTPDAQLVGQGLAGTIDLRTTRPLTYGKRAVVFNIRGERNSQDNLGADATNEGYRVSFSYIDQFADGKVGLTFGIARLESPLSTEGAGTYEPWHQNGTPFIGSINPTAIANPGVGPNVFVTDGIKVRTDMGKNRRDGAMAALEFRPSDSFHSILDLYYTKRDQTDNARSMEVNLGCYPALCQGPGDGTFPDNTVFGFSDPVIRDNTVVGGTLNQRLVLARNFLFNTHDKIVAAGWNNQWDMNERWTFTGDVSYSKATRDERQFETNGQIVPSDLRPRCDAGNPNIPGPPGCADQSVTQNVYDTGQFALSQDGMPQLTFGNNYADGTMVQVGPTIYGSGYSKIPHVTDELKSGRIDVLLKLDNWFSDVSAGINYSDRTKDKFQPEGNLVTNANATAWTSDDYYAIDPALLLAPTNLSYAGAGQALAWNVPGVLSQYYRPIVYGTPTDPNFAYLIGKNWTVDEKISTAYVRGNLNHELSANVTLKGNIGIQLVRTDQSSNAFFRDNTTGAVLPFTDGKKYTDVLPAINLAFVLPRDQAIRVGIARELARARMDQLKASSEQGAGISGGGVVPSGSGGNPNLDPWRADAFDVSYEKYFGGRAYFSAAVFYKKLKSYIFNLTDQNHDFSDFVATLPDCFLGTPPNCPTIATTGPYSGPVNGSGGNLKGVELSLSLPGEMFADGLKGFGTILSISQTSSNIRVQDPPGNDFITGNGLGSISLPGLSKTVWNATIYYEGTTGFSARVATRARSKYIGEVTNFANDRSFKFVKGDEITDFQMGYEFGEGRFAGLSVLFQVNNLTNEPYIAFARTDTRQQDFQQYGRQYLLGINYKL